MNLDSKIYVAGHTGLVGQNLVIELKERGYTNLLLANHSTLDLTDQKATSEFIEKEKPDVIFVCAARVGGINANALYPAEFIHTNLTISTNLVHAAHVNKIKKLVYLGSSCVYPKLSKQPIKEEYLLTGELESTNEAYAVAKIAGLKMCEFYNRQYGDNFISVMPCNLYGEFDNFDTLAGHVLPALINKFLNAKENKLQEVIIWGDGSPKREFLFARDLASALILIANRYNRPEPINIGSGDEVSITDLVVMIRDIVGYKHSIRFDKTMPNGTPRKILDGTKMKRLKWKASTKLREGIERTIKWYLSNRDLLKSKNKS